VFLRKVKLYSYMKQVYVLISDEAVIQGGSDMTGTNCDLFTHNQSPSFLNHLVHLERDESCNNGLEVGMFVFVFVFCDSAVLCWKLECTNLLGEFACRQCSRLSVSGLPFEVHRKAQPY
jgi:hypothetical protein